MTLELTDFVKSIISEEDVKKYVVPNIDCSFPFAINPLMDKKDIDIVFNSSLMKFKHVFPNKLIVGCKEYYKWVLFLFPKCDDLNFLVRLNDKICFLTMSDDIHPDGRNFGKYLNVLDSKIFTDDIEECFYNVYENIYKEISDEIRNRYINDTKNLCKGIIKGCDYKSNKEILDFDSYNEYRGDTYGMYVYNSVLEHMLKIDVDNILSQTPEYQTLKYVIGTYSSRVNDIYSFKKGYYDEDWTNILVILCVNSKLTLFEALEKTLNLIKENEAEIEHTCDLLLNKFSNNHDIVKYIEVLKFTVRGNLEFCKFASRYHG